MSRGLLLAAGFLCVALGTLGIFLPLLPTTPFLLLAAWFFARSSERTYQWLTTNRLFGEYIRNYHEGKGIPTSVKVVAIVMLWGAIIASVWAWEGTRIVQLLLLAIAVGVSTYIISIRPSAGEIRPD